MWVVGCPVANRAWILKKWFEHVRVAFHEADIYQVHWVFVVPEWDEGTKDLLNAFYERGFLNPKMDVIQVEEPKIPVRRFLNYWNKDRVDHMVDLRNTLLRRVRQIGPERFLSLDSDLLLAPDAVSVMERQLGAWDAVGLRTYMSEHILNPSFGQVVNGRLGGRFDQRAGCWQTDVIMAGKLMKPSAYQIDYRFHTDGEDVGWSMACKENGLKLAYAADARAKHVMDPSVIDRFDERVGF